jgi:hypothetical protein
VRELLGNLATPFFAITDFVLDQPQAAFTIGSVLAATAIVIALL